MDGPISWRDVANSLDAKGRGARTRLANALDMDRSQLARSLRADGYPDTRQAAIIQRFLNDQPSADIVPMPTPSGAMRVPLYGYAAASNGDRIAINEGAVLDWIDLPRGMSLRGEFFVIQAVGGSMEPRIWPGERKLVQRNVPPARNQDVVIEFTDGSAVLKTYIREKDGMIFAHQYNPDEEVRYKSTDVRALHAVFPL